MATECQQPSEGIDHDAYIAAVRPGKTIKISYSALMAITPGGENTLLHLAASVGNLPFIEQLLQLNRELLNATEPQLEPLLVKATNAEKDTALHLAAQGGFLRCREGSAPRRRKYCRCPQQA